MYSRLITFKLPARLLRSGPTSTVTLPHLTSRFITVQTFSTTAEKGRTTIPTSVNSQSAFTPLQPTNLIHINSDKTTAQSENTSDEPEELLEIQPEWLAMEKRVAFRKPKLKGTVHRYSFHSSCRNLVLFSSFVAH